MSINPITKNIILFPINILYDLNKEWAIKLLYKMKQGYKLNLNNPKSYTEKLQWVKLRYKNDLLTKLVDKYTVREYIASKCPELLVPLIWQGFETKDIPWDELPDKFVIKVTHGSGFNIICMDKMKLNREEAVKKIDAWLKAKFLKCYGEWFYGVERPRIIIEKFLDSGDGKAPTDYKIMCFSGKPQYIVVDTDRFSLHKRNVYDTNWDFRDDVTLGFPNDNPIVPPEKKISDELMRYASILSDGFPHVRVDLYIVNEKVYFGEMTFTNGAGFDKVRPHEFDLEMGELFVIPNNGGN